MRHFDPQGPPPTADELRELFARYRETGVQGSEAIGTVSAAVRPPAILVGGGSQPATAAA
jgi:hypothetical protein